MAHHTPTFINLPPPPSAPDTPSEAPGTPTSTTTSLSAVSTTAIKNGSRGDARTHTSHRGGHHQHASQNSLEAERADRISRLAGLSSISQHRPQAAGSHAPDKNSNSPQTTPTSNIFPQAVAPQVLGVPAYFDANGQPTAITKMSTSGTASATASDVDMMSTYTNVGRETETDSASGYIGAAASTMDIDDDNLTNRSVGGHDQFDDNLSDDGSASLVGFGEGANSTYSGPIYVRRPLPGTGGLERAGSSLSERVNAAQRVVDGVNSRGGSVAADEEATTGDATAAGSGAFQPGQTSALRETQHGMHTRHYWNHQQPPTSREAAERVMRERGLDSGMRSGVSPVASPSKKLAFEDQK
ncbi:unnamed protein product [Discula destructiva]